MHWLWYVPGCKNRNYWNLQPFKLGIQDKAHPRKCSQMINYFNNVPFWSSSAGPKNTMLYKIYLLKRRYYAPKRNVSPIWINTLEHLPLDTLADSPMWFKILTDIIYSNPSPHMVAPFFLFPLHWKPQCLARYKKREQKVFNTFQGKRKSWNCIISHSSSDINCVLITTVVDHNYKSSKISTKW